MLAGAPYLCCIGRTTSFGFEVDVRLEADDDLVRISALCEDGPPRMPIGRLLIHVGGLQHSLFVEGTSLQLQSDRQAALGESARMRQAGDAGQVGRYRVQVFKVEREGVVRLFADLEGRRRGRWPDDEIDLLEGFVSKSCE